MPNVALTFDISLSADCTTLTITDTTPVGTTTTGYNQSGGLQISDVTDATFDVTWYLPDTTTKEFSVSLLPTTNNPLPFAQGEVYSLQMDSFGGEAGDKFPDAVWFAKYTVDGTVSGDDVSFFTTCYHPNFCQACCCIDTKLTEVSICENPDVLNEEYINLQGAIASVGCGKVSKALALLNAVQKYCNNNCKDC